MKRLGQIAEENAVFLFFAGVLFLVVLGDVIYDALVNKEPLAEVLAGGALDLLVALAFLGVVLKIMGFWRSRRKK